jgi:pimeloyl-ACP methyl ester carboxylesterase
LLAEAFVGAGFASLRYDKRVVGPHAQDNLTSLVGKISMQSHVDEVASAVQILARQPDISADRMFVLANSEGTLHALNYQLLHPALPLAGLVLVAPPGRTVGAVARAQLAAQAETVPNGAALLALYNAAIGRFLAGAPVAPDPSLPPSVHGLLQGLETPVNLPFARELWIADASSLLERVDVPVLVVIGKKDIQVDWRADGERLQHAAAGHPDVTFFFPANANHVLKHEPRPWEALAPTEIGAGYNSPDAFLDPEAVEEILAWMRRIAH